MILGLFSPITVREVVFPNRLVMPPMVRFIGEMTKEVAITGGIVTPDVVEHYAKRVRAGTALVIVEATAVDPLGRCWENGFNLFADEHVENLAKLASGIKAAGGKSCIQLVHGGPQASAELSGGEVVGPSAVGGPENSPHPRELSISEIHAIQQRFADAAERAVRAGFDAVEVHGAHGYLLDSFLMKRRNQRIDEYGVDLCGRLRILLETCHIVRARIGRKALLSCRVSPFTKREEDYDFVDFAALVRGLESAGIDLLHISTDGAFKGYFGSDRSIGQFAREITKVPIIIAGGLREPAQAQRLIEGKHADFAAVGTAMLRDPEWAIKARAALA